EQNVSGVRDNRHMKCGQPAVPRRGCGDFLKERQARREPTCKCVRFCEACKLEAGSTADLFITAYGGGASAAIHRIESVLKGSDQRSLAGREWDEEVSLSCSAVDPNGTSDSQGHLREAQKPLDAALEQFRVYLRSSTADLLDLVPRCAQTLSTGNECV